MGDVHIPKPPPNAVGAKVEELIAAGHELYAQTVTGQPAGRVRRPTLFVIAIIGLFVLMADSSFGLLGLFAGVFSAIAMLLLLASDQVVEL